MNLPSLAGKWEDALSTIADTLRRAVDGTVAPLFVDYTNQRVIIGSTTASGSAGFQVLSTAGSFFSGNVTAQNVSASALDVSSTANFRSDVTVTGATILLGSTSAANVTAAGLNVTSTANFRSDVNVTGVTLIPAGTVAAPSLQVRAAGNGIYSPAVNMLGLIGGGSEMLRCDGVGGSTYIPVGTKFAIGQAAPDGTYGFAVNANSELNGNVGVNKAFNANAPLDVNGNAYISGTLSPGAISATSTGHFFSAINVTGTTTLLGNTIAANVTAAGLNITSTANFRSAINVTGEVIVSGSGTGITFPDGTKQTTAAAGAASKPTRTALTATASSTYTVPASVSYLRIRAVGGGGGGGGVANVANNAGGGGGSGGFCEKLITSPAASYTYAIGSGGAGGASSGQNGVAGGITYMTGVITASGGTGGVYNGGFDVDPGGPGGGATGGDLNIAGGFGFNGIALPNSAGAGGAGGIAPIFGAGGPGGQNAVQDALNGIAPGSGGGGGGAQSGAQAGGKGAAGLIIVDEFY